MKRVGVGIAGFGTVGRATAVIISSHSELIAQGSGVRLELLRTSSARGFHYHVDIACGDKLIPIRYSPRVCWNVFGLHARSSAHRDPVAVRA